jgi:hypothetical protein
MGKNPKFKLVKRCIFCTNKADSKEHAWSEWALNRLVDIPGMRNGIVGFVDGVPYHDPNQRHLRVRCVCKDCNTVWMKSLEDAVIPTIGQMMLDGPISLDIPQQWAITLWALKSAMVFEYIDPNRKVFYSDADRFALRKNQTLPALTAAWIARVDGIDSFYTRGDDVVSIATVAKLNGIITTIAYRRFVVQVINVRIHEHNGGPFVLDGNHARWGDVYVPIWPTKSLAQWPNRYTIATGALDSFHTRYTPDEPRSVDESRAISTDKG